MKRHHGNHFLCHFPAVKLKQWSRQYSVSLVRTVHTLSRTHNIDFITFSYLYNRPHTTSCRCWMDLKNPPFSCYSYACKWSALCTQTHLTDCIWLINGNLLEFKPPVLQNVKSLASQPLPVMHHPSAQSTVPRRIMSSSNILPGLRDSSPMQHTLCSTARCYFSLLSYIFPRLTSLSMLYFPLLATPVLPGTPPGEHSKVCSTQKLSGEPPSKNVMTARCGEIARNALNRSVWVTTETDMQTRKNCTQTRGRTPKHTHTLPLSKKRTVHE